MGFVSQMNATSSSLTHGPSSLYEPEEVAQMTLSVVLPAASF